MDLYRPLREMRSDNTVRDSDDFAERDSHMCRSNPSTKNEE